MRRAIGNFFLVSVLVLAVAAFATTAVRALLYAPETEVPVPMLAQPEQSALADPTSNPQRLRIPAIDVDAAVQYVGVNAAGNMAAPSNFKDVAWYKYGPVPGASGSSVIAGHLNNGLGLDGVFADLKNLEAGDEIMVTREDGSEARFVVTEKRVYPYDEVPGDIVFNPAGPARLNLITCAGKWIKNLKTYNERLIVFAELADS